MCRWKKSEVKFSFYCVSLFFSVLNAVLGAFLISIFLACRSIDHGHVRGAVASLIISKIDMVNILKSLFI